MQDEAIAGLPESWGSARIPSWQLLSVTNKTSNLYVILDEDIHFRLKEEVSRQVHAFSSLALKEMIVNALVHRNYSVEETVRIEITPEKISTVSPGGLVKDVVVKMSGDTIENFIRSGGRGVKGYRNPAISDLFYGGGQMDRAGSGLSDMWRQTVDNNGALKFGPNADNSAFEVTIWARPEAVDQFTRTAIPIDMETVRYSTNLLEFVRLPDKIWHVGTSAKSIG